MDCRVAHGFTRSASGLNGSRDVLKGLRNENTPRRLVTRRYRGRVPPLVFHWLFVRTGGKASPQTEPLLACFELDIRQMCLFDTKRRSPQQKPQWCHFRGSKIKNSELQTNYYGASAESKSSPVEWIRRLGTHKNQTQQPRNRYLRKLFWLAKIGGSWRASDLVPGESWSPSIHLTNWPSAKWLIYSGREPCAWFLRGNVKTVDGLLKVRRLGYETANQQLINCDLKSLP